MACKPEGIEHTYRAHLFRRGDVCWRCGFNRAPPAPIAVNATIDAIEVEGGATIAEAIRALPHPATGDIVRWTRHYSDGHGIDYQEPVRELVLAVDAATGDVYWTDRARAEGGKVAAQ